ncbi:hypothetical protein THIOSC13_1510002 [uncultured Thiomicrorhabdus sp.]
MGHRKHHPTAPTWQGTEYQNLSIAVNISSNQFSHEDFIHDLARQLDGANLHILTGSGVNRKYGHDQC